MKTLAEREEEVEELRHDFMLTLRRGETIDILQLTRLERFLDALVGLHFSRGLAQATQKGSGAKAR